MRFYSSCALVFAFILFSCGGNKTAQIWTDRPEFALYGEYFNNSQNQYKVTVRYFEFPSAELEKPGPKPDIVAGSWLKNASTGTRFKSLNNLFGAQKLSRSVFYQRLLAAGRIDNDQYLLPVSFNLPALIISRDRASELSNPFTIGFDEVKRLSKSYNTENRGAYTRMGFSPLWDDNFLFVTPVLLGAAFREAAPLAWDAAALDSSIDYIYNWTHEINTNHQAEEDFTFKYFIEPQERLVQSGRILFSYMESGGLFTLSESSKNNIDFRWIMEQNKIPIAENLVYLGIPKKGKAQKASKAFIQWFFLTETQRRLMEYSRANRINETIFGICGGFSSLTPVTEQIFPRFYPELFGRMPPSEFLTVHNNLPADWAVIKERIVLPYIHERAGKKTTDDVYPLEKQLADWIKINK
jgi:hypothetical protein